MEGYAAKEGKGGGGVERGIFSRCDGEEGGEQPRKRMNPGEREGEEEK